MVYPNEEQLKAACKTSNKGLVFYQKPALAKHSRQFAKTVGAKAISQAYKSKIIARQWISDAGNTEADTWWKFVARFSRVFAESAEGIVT